MKSSILLYLGLLFAGVSSYTMDCAPPVVQNLANSEILTVEQCDFELKFDLVGASEKNTMTFLYETHNSTVTCPEAVNPSIHIAEIECNGKQMGLDLYLPIVHLKGSKKVVNVIVNGNNLSIVL